MGYGCKRVIKDEDIKLLFDFYRRNYINLIGQDTFNKWIRTQEKHFQEKINIEKQQPIKKEGFIIQTIYQRSAGQDKPLTPKTVGALILKLADYKTPEIKGFIIDNGITPDDIEKCVNLLMKEVQDLCRKEGFDKYLVFSNLKNNTAITLFKSPHFNIERISEKAEQQEFIFKRNMNPFYVADPYNWLEKVLWYINYFIGVEFEELKYKNGLKIEDHSKLPIVINNKIIPNIIYMPNKYTQKIETTFIIFNEEPDEIIEYISGAEFQKSNLIFLFIRNKKIDYKHIVSIDEEQIDNIIKDMWMEDHV